MPVPILLAIGVGGILLLLLLIVRFKVNAFLALLITSILVGLAAGIPLATVPATDDAPERLGIIPAIIAGMGGTLGSVAILVALGSMLGRIIELSGGASSLAGRFTKLLGPRRVSGALTAAALILAIPVFFDVGFIILVPIIYGFSHAAGLNPVKFGLPVAGIMLAVHVAVPPHPGIVGGAALLGADVGMLTLLGIAIALPLGVLSHFVSKWLNRRDFPMLASTKVMFDDFGGGNDTGREGVGPGTTMTGTMTRTEAPPSAGMILTLILTPLVMIGAGTTGAALLPAGNAVRDILGFIGAPIFALLVTVLLAAFFLGVRRGWSGAHVSDVFESALPPAAIVILVTGAGGAFARILTESGIGSALAGTLLSTGLPIIVLAFVVALALRAAQGSATVAILTTAGLLAEAVTSGGYTPIQVVVIALAIAFGALGLSHVNDSGFWVVTRYLGLGVADGLRTWTVLTTTLGVAGFAVTSVVWLLVGGMSA
ncbi:GntP family transporter [Microbacterium sp. SLBN-146]|uniref:GntP family transporter n=1 Tax=Microbacterium sp. SLBN-146 TaxID=2768457 RepID=UPI0011522C68|nr:GntP family transporter [Microbacterium sp. SLBN-146]TQJ31699.1 GntP family gluconate:H+ symporter [Microbacterium sp. SLBN-146]